MVSDLRIWGIWLLCAVINGPDARARTRGGTLHFGPDTGAQTREATLHFLFGVSLHKVNDLFFNYNPKAMTENGCVVTVRNRIAIDGPNSPLIQDLTCVIDFNKLFTSSMRITADDTYIYVRIVGEGQAVHMFGRTVTLNSNRLENYDQYYSVLVLQYPSVFARSEVKDTFRISY